MSASGSLVVTDFGWDLLETIRSIGFAETGIDLYRSVEEAILGGVQIVFRFEKG